jgi:hypothetical protein
VTGSSYGWTYIYYGSLDGTTTVIHQNITQNSAGTNGLEFAVLFNERTGGNDNEQANTAIVNASTGITSWPQNGGGRIEWNVAATNVFEYASNVVVRLVRTGLANRAVKVSYTTYNRSAGPSSYLPASGVVSFAPDETSKDIPITIYDDDIIGADPEFSVELISASGGAWLGDRVTCLVRILNNDIPPTLTITKTAPEEILLQWPTNYTGFRLNYAVNLAAPIATRWRLFTNAVTTNGAFYNVSVSTTNPVQFFRLRKP